MFTVSNKKGKLLHSLSTMRGFKFIIICIQILTCCKTAFAQEELDDLLKLQLDELLSPLHEKPPPGQSKIPDLSFIPILPMPCQCPPPPPLLCPVKCPKECQPIKCPDSNCPKCSVECPQPLPQQCPTFSCPQLHCPIFVCPRPSCPLVHYPAPQIPITQTDQFNYAILQREIESCRNEGKTGFAYDMTPEFINISTKISQFLYGLSDTREIIIYANDLKKTSNVNFRLWFKSLVGVLESKRASIKNYPTHEKYMEALPQFFLPSNIYDKFQQPANTLLRPDDFFVDENDAEENGEENNLFYFREDVGVNTHHSFWHIVHSHSKTESAPCTAIPPRLQNAGYSFCHEDRRGELFYFMHKVILAKYATERLSHCMSPLLPFKMEKGGVVDTGYIPHLRIEKENETKWEQRPANILLPNEIINLDENCKPTYVTIDQITRNVNNINDTLGWGHYISKETGKYSEMDIDVLADMLEASSQNPNPFLYGSVHNNGHDFISRITSPHTTKGPVGVMGDTATAMRDPIFYRWHLFMNNLFDTYKNKFYLPHQPSRSTYPLRFNGIEVQGVDVFETRQNGSRNELHTFWSQQSFNISLAKDNYRMVGFKHLNHNDFEYRILVRNMYANSVNGTVRIFLVPRYDQNGNRFSLYEQQKYIVPMDVFNVNIPPGSSHILRNSVDSVLTTARTRGGSLGTNGVSTRYQDKKCGCGWPHHLLLPKGKEGLEGMTFDLVVMITDGSRYKWMYEEKTDSRRAGCKLAPLICGIPGYGKKFPDVDLPMGYPFDRRLMDNVPFIEDFVNLVENINLAQIRIRHHDVFLPNSWQTLNPEEVRNESSSGKTLCHGSRVARTIPTPNEPYTPQTTPYELYDTVVPTPFNSYTWPCSSYNCVTRRPHIHNHDHHHHHHHTIHTRSYHQHIHTHQQPYDHTHQHQHTHTHQQPYDHTHQHQHTHTHQPPYDHTHQQQYDAYGSYHTRNGGQYQASNSYASGYEYIG